MPLRVLTVPLLTLLFISVAARAAAVIAPFDSAKYMHVSEVKPGMKGYGVSVFFGTKLERFDVEVVSVLKNFNPKDDVVLIRCTGANLEHTGAIAGMSGSPIYLHDDAGRDRMIGAFAYGWPLTKDPIAGVQPIEYMLALPTYQKDSTTAAVSPTANEAGARRQIRWKLSDFVPMPGVEKLPRGYPLAAVDRMEPAADSFAGSDDSTRLQPLATPLMTGGLSPKLIAQFAPLFHAFGLTQLQAGGGGGAVEQNATTELASAAMQPGGVLAAPLLTGDSDITAIGTCTDVIGDRVIGFGHPFNNEGSINLPFGTGQINAIVAELRQSFKIGAMTRLVGTLTTDQSVGVAGHLGKTPPTMPIDFQVTYADGSTDQHYHFDCVIHPRFTPVLSVVAMTAALTGQRELPENHTIDYDIDVEFGNGRTIKLANVLADDNPALFFLQLAAPLQAGAENPFLKVTPKKMSGTIRVISETRAADILSVNVSKRKYKPGDMLTADVQYRRYRSAETTMPIDVKLPRDLPGGQYQLVVSGWERYVQDELMARPFRFNADSVTEVFDVLSDFEAIRHDAIYVRLIRQADGVAFGRTAMPRLPSSIRQVMLDAGRSDTTAFTSSDVHILPTKLILSGASDFSIEIESAGHSDAARQRPELPAPIAPPAQAGANQPRRIVTPPPSSPMPPK